MLNNETVTASRSDMVSGFDKRGENDNTNYIASGWFVYEEDKFAI